MLKDPEILLHSARPVTLPSNAVLSEPGGFCRFGFGVLPIMTQLCSLAFERQLFSHLLKENVFCGWGGEGGDSPQVTIC